MKTYHWNGDEWYERDWSVWHHFRHWFIWLGGWERANGSGWRLYLNTKKVGGGNRKLWLSPYPVSLFGGRITFFGWGWDLKVKGGWLVYSSIGRRKLYISPNGTPSQAVSWLIGAPDSVKKNAAVAG
jgi:hypothetical protein